MIAFLLADLRDWRERRMAKMMVKAAVILALGALAGPLHPEALAIACAAALIVSGWTEGYRYRSESAFKQLILSFPRLPREIAAGKALSLLVIWAALLLLFSPLLAASVIAWGPSLPFIASALLFSLIAFMVSGSAGFLLCLIFKNFARPFALVLFSAWTLPCFYLGWVRTMNPFFQIKGAAERGWGAPLFIGTSVEAAVALLLLALSIPLIAAERIRHHE
jgi:hypothetical protein